MSSIIFYRYLRWALASSWEVIEAKTTVLRKSQHLQHLRSGDRGTNLALNIPDQAFVLGTSPKFALGDGRSSKDLQMAVKQFRKPTMMQSWGTHDIDTVFKHCVQTLDVRHSDLRLKECSVCDFELLGTSSASNSR